MKKHLLIFAAAMSLSGIAKAQRNFGIATSNWSGINAMYLNPANIADSRERVAIDLISLNTGVDNNLVSLNTNGGLIKTILNGDTRNLFNINDKATSFSMQAPYAEIHGPGIKININHKHSIAITTRVRGINQFNNFSSYLYHTLTDTSFAVKNDVNLKAQNFNYTAHMWSEIGVSYAAVLLDNGENELKLGFTLRYLGGIGYLSLKGNNLDVYYKNGSDSVSATNSDIEFASNVFSTRNALLNGVTNNSILSQFFGFKSGWGVGGDIGLVYEYSPIKQRGKYNMDGKVGLTDYSCNRYLLRLSAAVTDIGSILVKAENNSSATITGNGYFTAAGLSANVKNFEDFQKYAVKQGFTADTSHKDARVYMPTALVLGADYNVYKAFYVNATFVANLANRQNFGNSFYNQLTITPRFDTRLFSAGLPITYNTLTSNMRMGLGLRFTGFFIGSDDLLAAFSDHQYGVNFYIGGFVPIGHGKASDRDHDGISDRNDGCPDEYGTWENQGCPDDPDREKDEERDNRKQNREQQRTDNDTTDNCPDLSIEAFTSHSFETQMADQVSKDTDGDGVPDDEDPCPAVAGPASNHGCPEPKAPAKKSLNLSVTTIQIPAGKTTIGADAHARLDQLVTVMKEYPEYHLVVEGYTDNTGNAEKNKTLSDIRANSVKDYLAAKGIDAGRIKTTGKGGSNPVADNSTPEGRAKNRRVVMRLEK